MNQDELFKEYGKATIQLKLVQNRVMELERMIAETLNGRQPEQPPQMPLKKEDLKVTKDSKITTKTP